MSLSHTHTHTHTHHAGLKIQIQAWTIFSNPSFTRWVLGCLPEHHLMKHLFIHCGLSVSRCIFHWSETQRRGKVCGTLNSHQNTPHPSKPFLQTVFSNLVKCLQHNYAWKISVPVLMGRRDTQRPTDRRPCDCRAEMGVLVHKPRMPKIAGNFQKVGRKQERFSLKAFGESIACWHFDLRLLASRIMREQLPVVLSYSVYGN